MWYDQSKQQERKGVPFKLALKQMQEDANRLIWFTWFFDTRGRLGVDQYVGACLHGANYQKAVVDSAYEAPITEQTERDIFLFD